jgi:hypothetical protein
LVRFDVTEISPLDDVPAAVEVAQDGGAERDLLDGAAHRSWSGRRLRRSGSLLPGRRLMSSRPGGERVPKDGQPLRKDAVVDPPAPLFAPEQAGLVQDLEMVADRGLGQPERLGEVAHARFPVGTGRDQADDSQAGRIGQNAQRRGELARLVPRERRLEHRRAAFLDDPDELHANILTAIDP